MDASNLTTSQFLLWTGQRLHPRAPLYNMVITFDIAGPIEPVHFERAFHALLVRSDALRTVIDGAGDAPRQRVLPVFLHAIERVDLRGKPDPDAALRGWVSHRATRLFDLRESLFDTALIHVGEERWVWYLNQHHLATDGWSAALVYRHVADYYRRSIDGMLDAAPPLPAYAAYVEHERAFRDSGVFAKVRAHWQEKLRIPLEPIQLYGKRAPRHSTRTERVTRDLGLERSNRLRQAAAHIGGLTLTGHSALFNVFATALFAYLHRVSGERRLALGAPSHNRASAAFKETIGVFIEVLPYVIDVAEDETFRSLLAKVQAETAAFLRYAQPGTSTPDVNRTFNVLLNYIHASFPPFDGLPMRSEWVHPGHGDSGHHLRLQVHDFDASGSFVLHFDFSLELFAEAEREAAADQFMCVLDAFLEDPSRSIADVALLSLAAGRRLVEVLSPAHGPLASGLVGQANFISRGGAEDTLVAMFDAQVRRTPDAVAVRDGARTLTYRQLSDRVDRLARRLRGLGVDSDVLVGIHAPRSLEGVVGVLGALAAGGAYVPVSPSDPPERVATVLGEAAVAVLLTTVARQHRLPHSGVPVVLLDAGDSSSEIERAPSAHAVDAVEIAANGDRRSHRPAPSDAAYVLFTSGSTGRPKGVVIEHGSLAHYIGWAKQFYAGDGPLSFPLFTSLSFDLTVTSLFVPLVTGGTVVVYEENAAVPALLRVLEDNAVQAIKLTPAHLSLLRGAKRSNSRARLLILGGEDLKSEQARHAAAVFGDVAIYNEYGPTEATVGCMIHRFDAQRDTGTSVPIGASAGHARIYVLDGALNPVPRGVMGEIWVSGPGVARGYLNRPDLTAERFRADPFMTGARTYRTGDLGRWRADGVLEFLGRADRQVKIRGARIELGEVEGALLQHAAIADCVVHATRIERAAREEGVVHCQRCGLPSNYPGATYDAEGVCQLCRAFDGYREKANRYFRSMDDLRLVLERARARSRGDYDCLMLLSGGKDSTYALYQLERMGVRVLCFTLDNGYISEHAKANIRRVTASLGVDHVFGTTPAMNAIFVDSLKRHSNVCNGCFKTIYTLGARLARDKGIPVVVTGLSRGQFFETRLTEELFGSAAVDVDRIDRVILEARKAYHRADDAVARLLDTRDFRDDALFGDIEFVDFYRYCDVALDEMLDFLERHAPWIRPADTGRSTNCLINQAGIYVHRLERGYHNYAFPYSWDVRMGHKTRDAALHELNDDIDSFAVRRILREIGYDERLAAVEADDVRLTAYYVASTDVSATDLRAHLARTLPESMVPSHFVRLERLPLTPHGKVDRAALPAPHARAPGAEAAHTAPRRPVEERIAAVWAEVLKLDRVGVLDEFLELGGNSLLAIQIISRVNHAFGIDLSLRSAFEASTVAALAELVERTLLGEIEALSETDAQRLTAK